MVQKFLLINLMTSKKLFCRLTNPKDRCNFVVKSAVEELMLTIRVGMESTRKLLEKLAEGIKERETSQAETKTGLTDEINFLKIN